VPILIVTNLLSLVAVGVLGFEVVRLRVEAAVHRARGASAPAGAAPTAAGETPGGAIGQPVSPAFPSTVAPPSGGQPATGQPVTALDVYLDWVSLQERGRAEMRSCLGKVAAGARQLDPANPAMQQRYTEYREYVDKSAALWQESIDKGRRNLTVPAEVNEFDQDYMAVLAREREAFVAH